jgi:pimeloyl-ACP methyl ester carboxylesterase
MTNQLSSTMATQTRVVDGLEIRYAESEEARDRTILMLSPWPESLYAFESIWPQLSEHSHLVAIDLPGFGHSERRDQLLSPSAMGEFLIRLLDAWRLDSPHVVGPDVGTGAALFAAARHPSRFTSLIVGNGATAFPLQVAGALKDLIESYAGDRFVESTRYVRSYPHDLPVLGELLADIQTPVQLVAGIRDALVPRGNVEYLHARLPNSKLDILDAGHFLWEESAKQYAAIITDWVTGGYNGVGA